MIYREGGCLDTMGMVWVRLEYDGKRDKALVVIRESPDGRRQAIAGVSGPMAKRFYDRLNVYFFGDDRN